MTRRGSKEPSPDNKKQVWQCPKCKVLHTTEERMAVCHWAHSLPEEDE